MPAKKATTVKKMKTAPKYAQFRFRLAALLDQGNLHKLSPNGTTMIRLKTKASQQKATTSFLLLGISRPPQPLPPKINKSLGKMLTLTQRAGSRLLLQRPAACGWQRRFFSPRAVHARVFPATLHHYRRAAAAPVLFDRGGGGSSSHLDEYGGVEVAADGLVYPKAERDGSNGATVLPNTFSMQEFTRNRYDEWLDSRDAGQAEEVPQIYTISKATPIPDDLILIYEHLAWFSLQPSRGMPLHELNHVLDEFFQRMARKASVEAWLAAHPFEEASDNAEAGWMHV
ncbi:hypothetical protein CCM_08491 [Cordyceps militaris CM01]|uniref:Tse2 ADP-ribosyltransferase toxin domain-containing protein n=1 Tax=Cordyceps militaris (strain CM01) TaxID=983644 RepID=G3JRQ7_CORMM|nr:uncharacterized protein CCM_08491 [Cordyceps militaris CM01]EGX88447.1 hypothetical protein CCM_08491 [Cordyceps militaris CM01]